ncbi:hypothetical protein BSZ22_05140 [Bradyrhizobium canariense]|uniref:Uncharacterized protein n=1 Tax=Bradyrhizobium canariense TaxID=255045 RepID=A0A1X3GRP2_9BRAD|nr:hypothetical protein BST65_15315 [Bradyrhizobium canariense]OSI38023.1 hypothetical protein BST66_02845 [Bradyrhizobium canariense]OSI53558.1 hypothetical protein BSZ20_03045 [Bradyrhizobium canariense]OSI56832.1 hypothetical protein BST67_02845 [Bradyrhizobium canariense]OSI59604.1 hypothetical protein BSZ15_04015 [Bradyrhizobium canariense]
MRDIREQLDRLRNDAADCKSISDLATDLRKRELFARLADHLSALASEVERATAVTVSGTPPELSPQHRQCWDAAAGRFRPRPGKYSLRRGMSSRRPVTRK